MKSIEVAFQISKMTAGIGLFLLGITFLEEALRKLAGRTFKLFLKKHTTNKFKAVAAGAVVTGVLQSSSVVNLMVLAFVGAGVLTMQNALAVILGTNIGTTLTSWIVATLGFKLSIEGLAFPIIGFFGITMVLFKNDSRWYSWSKFLVGFGLLFVGLGFMKEGFGMLAEHMNLSVLAGLPVVIYVLAGFLITTLIQSSSATVAIILTALNGHAISLLAATAMVLGSEVGTTIKLLMASINGIAAKKRVAFGNFAYNTFVIVAVLIALRPINYFITDIMQIGDNLLALVIFQSGINILGVIIFFPFLNLFGKFLNKRFLSNNGSVKFIKVISPAEGGDLALEALVKEARRLLFLTMDFINHSFGSQINLNNSEIDSEFQGKSTHEKYKFIKHLYGEIHNYSIKFNKEGLNTDEKELLERTISSARNCMFAAKGIKDSLYDIDQLRNSSNDAKYQYYKQKKREVLAFYEHLSKLILDSSTNDFDEMVTIYNQIRKGYVDDLSNLYQEGLDSNFSELEISMLINFNRELYGSYAAITWAVKDQLLNKDQAKYFAELPGFIP